MKHGLGIVGGTVLALVVSIGVVRFSNTATPGGWFHKLTHGG